MKLLNHFMFWKKTPIIEFVCRPDFQDIIPTPKPAGHHIPDWFKKLNMTTSDPDVMPDPYGFPGKTAKACKPLIDALSFGFTLTLASDVRVRSNFDCTEIDVKNPVDQFPVIEFHHEDQVGGKNSLKNSHGKPLKFINYWVIKTAPGWSTLFIPPLNHLNLPFTCLGGLVDTDRYAKEVNFPAIWTEPNFDGLLKAGTPLVTAIPIKRNAFKQKALYRVMSEEELYYHDRASKLLQTRSSYYTEYVRVKK